MGEARVVFAIHQLWGVSFPIHFQLNTAHLTMVNSVPNMFSMLRSQDHSQRKRQLSNIYAKSYLQRTPVMGAMVEDVIKYQFLGIIERSSESGGPIEIYDLLARMAMDGISAYMFGLASGTRMLENPRRFRTFIKVYEKRSKHSFLMQETPMLWSAAKVLGLPAKVSNARGQVDKLSAELCHAVEARIERGDSSDEEAVVFKQLSKHAASKLEDTLGKGEASVDKATASELLDHLRK